MKKIVMESLNLLSSPPVTGIGVYCEKLGASLLQAKAIHEQIYFYLPIQIGHYFGDKCHYLWESRLNQKFDNLLIRLDKYVGRWSSRIIAPLQGYLNWSRKQQADILHITLQLTKRLYTCQSKKVVLTIHDLNILHDRRMDAFEREQCLLVTQRNIDKADYIIFISKFVQQDVLKNINIQNKPHRVIYNGCDTNRLLPCSRPSTYIPKRSFLLTIGTASNKNIHTLLPLLEKNTDIELIIIGPINSKNRLNYQKFTLGLAKSFSIMDRLTFVGPVNQSEKAWYLMHCLAFMFPSISEGFGLPVIEAMHFGKPVFISNRTSLPEVGDRFAYYFKNFDPDHMQEVFDKGMAHYNKQASIEAIKTHAQSFSWERSAKAYWEVYRSLY